MFTCNKCQKQYEKKAAYAGHRSQCLGKVDLNKARSAKKTLGFATLNKTYTCPICDKKFETNHSWNGHKSGCGKSSKNQDRFGNIDVIGVFECKCGCNFETKRKLNGHQTQCPLKQNKNHWKKFLYNNVSFDSSWEVEYAKWLDVNNIKWVREPKGFNYIHNKKKKVYYPDFYLPDTNEYIEIKGWTREIDYSKWEQFEGTLIVLRFKDLKKLGLKIK